jgi:hypothetical protein
MANNNYYASELAKIRPNACSTYAPQIKITQEQGSDTANTKWLSLSNESASELVKWLREHYQITETAQP